ncbi:TPA: HK97 family phage prohead protease [Acinetobacter baumannii]|uniref:HK97 family phage prohead protease n=1 Tax=Acinetobacter baumannii TaxID=470 RepID=UPI001FF6B0ED|nr:HK97 family phage prohead protease [Acinetobacter baumannii]MCJ9255824.1 HK97 family phage prohead protease [Acinetobacter baumannii]HCQ9559809.1 HK97 family phage prohead protease [Acinetobacter baumannii]
MPALQKTFSSFEIKSVNEEKRTFRGVATTSDPDRAKDIMVPEGAMYELPMPFLFHHEHTAPVGIISDAKLLPKGKIEIEFSFPEIKEEGNLKARVEEAFQTLKYGLAKGLSIGFMADWNDVEQLEGGGFRFKKWQWYETSLVTIPCNKDATVDLSKAFEEHKAALGNKPQKTAADGDSSEQKHVIVKLNSPTKGGVSL